MISFKNLIFRYNEIEELKISEREDMSNMFWGENIKIVGILILEVLRERK